MSFTYPTVSLNSHPYNVYSDIEDADLYVDASITSAADTWRDATLTTIDTKSRALVTATRWLDSVNWAGDKADDAQEHAFPRKNIDGVDSTELPIQLITACIELSLALIDNADARTELSDPLAKSLRAGPVGIEYFRPESNTQTQTPFPANVMALISRWLGGSGTPAGSISFGTCETSDLLDEKFDFSHGI